MIAIVHSNVGNIFSVQTAIERLGVDFIVTDNREEIMCADKVIFPGVGHAESALKYLHKKRLIKTLQRLQQPFLGICLGMQLMCRSTEECALPCLGIFEEQVKKFPNKAKVPHMGWNNFEVIGNDPLLKTLNPQDNLYYVHSYYAETGTNTLAVCHYQLPFSSILKKGNYYGVQFHPEKSAHIGEQLLKNFIAL